jgi:hypothetical protein
MVMATILITAVTTIHITATGTTIITTHPGVIGTSIIARITTTIGAVVTIPTILEVPGGEASKPLQHPRTALTIPEPEEILITPDFRPAAKQPEPAITVPLLQEVLHRPHLLPEVVERITGLPLLPVPRVLQDLPPEAIPVQALPVLQVLQMPLVVVSQVPTPAGDNYQIEFQI